MLVSPLCARLGHHAELVKGGGGRPEFGVRGVQPRKAHHELLKRPGWQLPPADANK